MGLFKMHLLMILSLPSFNKQKLVCVCLREIIIIAQTAVLGADSSEYSLILYRLNERLSLIGKAFKLNVYGIHN